MARLRHFDCIEKLLILGLSMRRIVAALLAVAIPGCFIDFGELQEPGAGGTSGSGGSASGSGGQSGSGAVGGTAGSAATGGSSSGGSGGVGAGGSGGVGAGGSGGSDCNGGAPAVDYVISRIANPSVVNVDGVCNESIWTSATAIPFTGPSTTDNSVNCRLAWTDGSPPMLFGCCQNTDTDLRATITAKDGDVYGDDSFEYFLRPNEEAVLADPLTVKLSVNILGVTLDTDGDPPTFDKSYDSNFVASAKIDGTLNDMQPDTGYTIEWSHELLYQPAFSARYRCGFAMNDYDLSGRTDALAFPTTAPGLNTPSSWGLCAYACPVDPG